MPPASSWRTAVPRDVRPSTIPEQLDHLQPGHEHQDASRRRCSIEPTHHSRERAARLDFPLTRPRQEHCRGSDTASIAASTATGAHTCSTREADSDTARNTLESRPTSPTRRTVAWSLPARPTTRSPAVRTRRRRRGDGLTGSGATPSGQASDKIRTRQRPTGRSCCRLRTVPICEHNAYFRRRAYRHRVRACSLPGLTNPATSCGATQNRSAPISRVLRSVVSTKPARKPARHRQIASNCASRTRQSRPSSSH